MDQFEICGFAQCSKKLFDKKSYLVHILNDHENPTFQNSSKSSYELKAATACPFKNCGLKFHYEKNYLEHIVRDHLAGLDIPETMPIGKPPKIVVFVTCGIEGCHRKFNDQHKYKNHLEDKETHAWLTFPDSVLKKPIPCPFQGCRNRYHFWKNYAEHAVKEHLSDLGIPAKLEPRIDPGEKKAKRRKFKCENCGARYFHNHHLKVHIAKKHSGIPEDPK